MCSEFLPWRILRWSALIDKHKTKQIKSKVKMSSMTNKIKLYKKPNVCSTTVTKTGICNSEK